MGASRGTLPSTSQRLCLPGSPLRRLLTRQGSGGLCQAQRSGTEAGPGHITPPSVLPVVPEAAGRRGRLAQPRPCVRTASPAAPAFQTKHTCTNMCPLFPGNTPLRCLPAKRMRDSSLCPNSREGTESLDLKGSAPVSAVLPGRGRGQHWGGVGGGGAAASHSQEEAAGRRGRHEAASGKKPSPQRPGNLPLNVELDKLANPR